MTHCFAAHATHPDAYMALALAAAQVDAQRAAVPAAAAPTLGWLYLSAAYAPVADAVLADAQARWPGCHWVGCSAVGVMACGTEYQDEPALALMLATWPAEQFQVFHGRQPLSTEGARADQPIHLAQVHASPDAPELEALLAELAERTDSGYLFGGLASGASALGDPVHIADGVWRGGLSGVGFAAGLPVLSRVTQGCQPVGPTRRITAVAHNVVLTLDDQPALPQILADLELSLDRPREALHGLRRTLVGLTDGQASALDRGGQFGADTRVRHLIGIDPGREGVAVADLPEPGQQLSACRRDAQAARRDLVRIGAEIRDALDVELAGAEVGASALPGTASARIAGAVYVSCSGRGGAHFGGPSAEAQIVQHALGDVPWVGFFAAGEIAHQHLYGYTGVLTVWLSHEV